MTAVADPVAPSTLGIHERVVAATLTCVARHGLNKTTIDDVAREAGCSRATLYRHIGGKAELVHLVVRTEAERITDQVRAAADLEDSLEDAVVAMLVIARKELDEHAALRFVADFEPERLLPHLTFGGGDRFLARVSAAFAPALERFLPGHTERSAEWIARVGLTLWLCPNGPVSFADTDRVREYVRAFVVPGLQSISNTPSPAPANTR
jgi:AcrR family transcriptional regulator